MSSLPLRGVPLSAFKPCQNIVVFPHQLDWPRDAVLKAEQVFLVEEPLYFPQTPIHRQKLMLLRAAMKRWGDQLKGQGVSVRYCQGKDALLESVCEQIATSQGRAVAVIDPSDDWLTRRFATASTRSGLDVQWLQPTHFLTQASDWTDFTGKSGSTREKLFFTEFYIRQRKRLKVLLSENDGPRDGKWSFDNENRKRLPKGTAIPDRPNVVEDAYHQEARQYVSQNFPRAIGEDLPLHYPSSPEGSQVWLDHFVQHALLDFGPFEDAIAKDSPFLFHSVLTPMLNIGLLTPQQVLQAALAKSSEVPMNSLEGFIRQVIGWREFVHQVYRDIGRKQRTTNFFQHHRRLPAAFYDGSTGIPPVDATIRHILRYGYCHHIERLMVLGNFMLLCELEPDDVYQWFMEMFVDAYDWVMVPNVYGMSQYADGGMMTTKPYVSGSAYIKRMSDHQPGKWCDIWDGLYWRFVARHEAFYAKNPRCSMMVHQMRKLGDKLAIHLAVAEAFLDGGCTLN